jgi:hypothetical protein
VVVSLSHFGLYAASRRQRLFPGPGLISFAVLLLVLYPLLWSVNYGPNGGQPLVGMGLVVLAASTFEGKWRWVATGAVLVVTGALFAGELPTISAAGYASPAVRLIDNYATFVIVSVAMMMLGLVTEASFAHEREKARDYARVVEQTNEQLALALERNRLLAHTDPLTQLPNRRYLEPIVARRVEESQRYRRPLSLAVVDIDHFKRIGRTMALLPRRGWSPGGNRSPLMRSRYVGKCRSQSAGELGDGGPGNVGGYGFPARGLSFANYESVFAGYVDDAGERRSIFEPNEAGVPLLVEVLLQRQREEHDGDVGEHRGMPLSLPALTPEQIQLVETWIDQGRPR